MSGDRDARGKDKPRKRQRRPMPEPEMGWTRWLLAVAINVVSFIAELLGN